MGFVDGVAHKTPRKRFRVWRKFPDGTQRCVRCARRVPDEDINARHLCLECAPKRAAAPPPPLTWATIPSREDIRRCAGH